MAVGLAVIAVLMTSQSAMATHSSYDYDSHDHTSGDVSRNSDEATQKLNCDDRNVCQEVNTVINGNGNTVVVNTNGNSGNAKGKVVGDEMRGDGGGGY